MNFLRVNNFTELRLSSLRPSELKVDAKSVALASAAALGGLGVLYLGYSLLFSILLPEL